MEAIRWLQPLRRVCDPVVELDQDPTLCREIKNTNVMLFEGPFPTLIRPAVFGRELLCRTFGQSPGAQRSAEPVSTCTVRLLAGSLS